MELLKINGKIPLKEKYQKLMIDQYRFGIPPILNIPLSSDANDISGNSLNGTLYGSPSFTTPVNGVLNLGTSKYMTIEDSDLLSFCDGSSDKPFSISFKVKRSGDSALISKRGTAGSGEWQLTYQSTTGVNLILFNNNNSSAYINANVGTTMDTNEHHIVATYSGNGANTGIEIWIDKVKKTLTRSGAGSYTRMANSTAKVVVGKLGFSDSLYISDYIKQLKIYNYVISEVQITDLYNE